ncbi:MAG: GNAT family N-acetyltransferase [Flavobacteriales bacterium]|nr:GNAT family N-acetyltransferase [Flavobacteriales bacterium]
MSQLLTIYSSKNDVFSPSQCTELYEIMRDAYARTEVEIWGENYVRLPEHEFQKLIDDEVILGAALNGQLVGTLYLKKVNAQESSFGLLGVHSSAEGKGIGSKLIEVAENQARLDGSDYMVIDILRPRDFQMPGKNRLRTWYEKMGYEYTYSENFQDRRPDRAVDLKVPSVFDCFRKKL